MNELSLFSGAGGGLLGTKLLGWRHIGYVEWDGYCQQVIAQRIKDGFLDEAPIFGDVREFVQSGAAEQYRGFADVVTAGFPCQPFSVAGKQAAADDPRNMWPATRDVIRIVRPKNVLLENVPGLIASGYAGIVCADLVSLGYVGRNGSISAADCGANHLRERLWFLAHARCIGDEPQRTGPIGSGQTSSREGNGQEREWIRTEIGDGREDVANVQFFRRQQVEPDDRRAAKSQRSTGSIEQSGRSWWDVEPGMGRVADGVAHRVDRLKALGNGQVPAVVVRAWTDLTA